MPLVVLPFRARQLGGGICTGSENAVGSEPQAHFEATMRAPAGEPGSPGASTPVSVPIPADSLERPAQPVFSAPLRDEKPRWGRPVAQWRPAQAIWKVGTKATSSSQTTWEEGAPLSKARAGMQGEGRALLPPLQSLSWALVPPTTPSSLTPFPRSTCHPPLCRPLLGST